MSSKIFKVSSFSNNVLLPPLPRLVAFGPIFPAVPAPEHAEGLEARACLSGDLHLAAALWVLWRGLGLAHLLIQWHLQVRKLNMSWPKVQWLVFSPVRDENILTWQRAAGSDSAFHICIYTYAHKHAHALILRTRCQLFRPVWDARDTGIGANRYCHCLRAALEMRGSQLGEHIWLLSSLHVFSFSFFFFLFFCGFLFCFEGGVLLCVFKNFCCFL